MNPQPNSEDVDEDLKRDLRVIDENLKIEINPGHHLDDIEKWVSAIIANSWPPNNKDFFLKTMLPKFVQTLLRRGDFEEEVAERVNSFFQVVISLIIKFIPHDVHELLETLSRLFNSTHYAFYNKVGRDDIRDSPEKLQEPKFTIPRHNNMWDMSFHLQKNINFFGHQKGFDAILQRISSKPGAETSKVSLPCLKLLLKPIVKIKDYLNVNNFLKNYAEELRQNVFTLILHLSDDELKNEDKKVISDITHQIEQIFRKANPSKASETIEKFTLNVAWKCFRSPYLEKRLAGLNDIKETINLVSCKEDLLSRPRGHQDMTRTIPQQHTCWLTSRILVKWIKEKKVMEHLYGQNLHGEILRRCGDIPRFLAVENELTKEHLDLIWDASLGKHESIQHMIYLSVGELATHLPLAEIDYLFDKIKSIPYESYSIQTLMLVRHFSISAINVNQKMKNKKWYGLVLFWDLIQDETAVSPDITNQALQYLIDFLNWNQCSSQRLPFMELCIENLRQSKSVPQSLKLLMKIIDTHPQKRKKDSPSQTQIVEWLEEQYQLLALFFKDLQNYKAKARITLGDNIDPNISQAFLVGKTTHQNQIKDRLDFLEMVLQNSSLVLNQEQTDILWQCIISDALTSEERDLGFHWLEKIKIGNQEFPFAPEVPEYLFLHKFPTLDLSTLSGKGFSFFDYFFRFLNWKRGNFQSYTNKPQLVVRSMDLVGQDILWKIAFEAQDSSVGSRAIAALIGLYKNFIPENTVNGKNIIGKHREQFIRICMANLSETSKRLQTALRQSLETTHNLRIDRCLTLLKNFLEEFEIKGGGNNRRHGTSARGSPINIIVTIHQGARFTLVMHSNETVGSLRQKISEQSNQSGNMIRIITNGRELKDDRATLADHKFANNQQVHVTPRRKQPEMETQDQVKSVTPDDIQEDESSHPSLLLSSHEYFHQLFQLLTYDEVTGEKIWELLMLLPTNSEMLNVMRSLQVETQSVASWDDLLDPNSTYKLLYSLQIVDFLMQCNDDSKPEQITEKELWCKQFITKGGVKHLLKILMNNNFVSDSRGSKRKVCLALVLKIINFFLLVKKDAPYLQDNVASQCMDGMSLIRWLLEIMWNVASSPSRSNVIIPVPQPEIGPALPPGSSESNDGEIVKHAMDMLVAWCLSDLQILRSVLSLPQMEDWISCVVLHTPDQKVREYAANGLHVLCKKITDSSLGSLLPHTFTLNKLLSFLSKIDARLSTCEQYFDLLNNLVKDACEGVAGGKATDFAELVNQLMQLIIQQPIIERRNSPEEDKVLIGLMNLLCTLISKESSFKIEAGERFNMVSEVFHRCLFNIPTMDDHGPLSPPKCKTRGSRNVAFKLLTELCRNCDRNFKETCELLLQQHVNGEKRTQWHYHPSGHEKSPFGYVGLKNLGATCYMNSLMQQFYMIPQFRYNLFLVDKQEEDKNNSVLYQLQSIFAYLQESEKKYYDTRPFCNVYKDHGDQPMNPSVQMDADEFFNILFDKLENLIKDTKQASILKQFFGGTIINQIISKECPHVSEREENFFTLSVEIKNKKTILESLELYVEGDMLEGDNKYHCGKCQAKVDALKRCCIKTLPNVLIIHMKRFEFDLELMKRIKVNDLCEFPNSINMEPYTKEGLARREGKEIPESEIHPPSYYEYELAGILVHTGTAESGHYYSFIREREPRASLERQWFQFNDTVVEPFDVREIPRCCFGGAEPVPQWDQATQKSIVRMHSRVNNAYMLFYERIHPEDLPPMIAADIQSASSLVPPDIFKSLWEENMSFLRDKYVFDTDYFNFLWDVVSLDTSPPVLDFNVPWKNLIHPTLQTIQLGTKFVVETLSHAKEKHNLRTYVEDLKNLYQKHIPACKWFIETMTENLTWIKQMLFVCIVPETREAFASLVNHVIARLVPFEQKIYEEELQNYEAMEISHDKESNDEVELNLPAFQSKSLIIRFMDGLFGLLKEAHMYWRHFAQFFLIMRDFAKFGSSERRYFLSRNAISVLIEFYLQDDSPNAKNQVPPTTQVQSLAPPQLLPAQVAGPLQPRQKKTKMGDKFNTPILAYMIELLSIVTRGSATESSPPGLLEANQVTMKLLPPSQLPGEILSFSKIDREMIYCPAFYQKVIKENINTPAIIEIILHLCWENEEMSKTIINIVCKGIHMLDYDYFKPYFEVLTALLGFNDSKRVWRVHFSLESLLAVIEQNLRFAQATLHSIRFLLDLTGENSEVRMWMFTNRGAWMESWLFIHTNDPVRETMEELITALVPEIPTYITPSAVEQPKTMIHLLYKSQQTQFQLSPQTFKPQVITPEAEERLRNIYQNLLSLLPNARNHCRPEQDPSKPNEDPKWKLPGYFRLLKWCIRTPVDKLMFTKKFVEFTNLFFQIDSFHYECDENKREITSLWHHVLVDSPENLELLLANEPILNKLLDYFISLRPSERFYSYNGTALPAFYKILDLLCKSETFQKKAMTHKNFDWAVKFLYLLPEYGPVSAVIYEILKKVYKYPEFRQHQLPLLLIRERSNISWRNVVRLLDLLIQSEEDCILFCYHNGIDYINTSVEMKSQDRTKFDEEWKEVFSGFLTILGRVTKCMIENKNQKMKQISGDFLRAFDSKLPVVYLLSMLLRYLDLYNKTDEVTANCCELINNIVQLDSVCLEQLLFHLHREHEKVFLRYYSRRSDEMDTSPALLPAKPRPKPEEYYVLVHNICVLSMKSPAKSKFSQTVALAIMIAIETTHLDLFNTKIVMFLQEIWDNKQLAASDFLHTNRLLDKYVTQVLSQNINLLDQPICVAFLRSIFPTVQARLPQPDWQAIILSLSEAIRTSIVRIRDVIKQPNNESAIVLQSSVANLCQILKALTIVFLDERLKTYFIQENKPHLLNLYELTQTREPIAQALNSVHRIEELTQLTRALDLTDKKP